MPNPQSVKYIALLDILGYRELILKNKKSDNFGLFENIPVYIQSALSKGIATQTEGRYHYNVTDTPLNSIIISDTLIFWTQDTTAQSFFELLDCIHRLMVMMYNTTHLFLRGAITAGEFYHQATGYIKNTEGSIVSHPMIYGNGLIYAHDIEVSLAIAGCVIDKKAIDLASIDEATFKGKWEGCISDKRVIHYPAPFKKEISDQWMVNWVVENLHPTREELKDAFGLHNRATDPPDVQLKINNTLAFYDFVKGT